MPLWSCLLSPFSLEVWDSGARNERENHDKMMSVFGGFDVSRYQNPKYDYVDLMTGQKRASQEFTAAVGGDGQLFRSPYPSFSHRERSVSRTTPLSNVPSFRPPPP